MDKRGRTRTGTQNLAALFNRVEEENKISIQWIEAKTKSVTKGGNKESIQESQKKNISDEHSI